MISRLTRVNGVLKIEIDGEIYEPLSFKSFRPTERNISDFYKAGVKLFSILTSGLHNILGVPYSLYGESWIGKGQYNFDVIDKQIELFKANAPGCYFALMIQLDTREWWINSHENFPDSFTNLSQMASNEEWREAAAEYLQAVLTHVEEKYGDIMYGYFLLCGTTTEWFSERDYEAAHPFKEEYYKKYMGDLEAEIPKENELVLPQTISFNDNRNVKNYRRAHAEQTADTILYFAAKAQEILQHNKLLGVYFGYLLELAGERLWNTGHLAYEKVFFSNDIDMISSPSSYDYRSEKSTSAFMVTYKTLDLHDKLYYLEFDHITHVAPAQIEGITIPGGRNKCKDEIETLNIMQRDFMLCVANGAALWWFDMFEGWFYSKQMMDNICNMVAVSKQLSLLEQESVAEIAVIAAGETLYGVSKNSCLNDALLRKQREGLARMGAPYDLFSLGDILNINKEQYKLFIFLDVFEIDEEQERWIQYLKADGKTLLWMYAPGFLTGGLEKMKCLTDIKIEFLEEHVDGVDCSAELLSKPMFCVMDENAVGLVRYDNGKYALAYKKLGDYISVYSSVGNLRADLLRSIAKLAGVHIYSERNPIYVNNNIVGVYAQEDDILNMKQDGVYEEVFSGEKFKTVNQKLFVKADMLHSKLFLKREEK